MNCVGLEAPDFKELLKPEFISSREGSSLVDLTICAAAHKLNAVAMTQLDALALQESQYPVLLHCRRDLGTEDYNHWILYLGKSGDKARICDPPKSVRIMSFADVLAIWDGIGLVVSDKPINSFYIRSASVYSKVMILAAAMACVGTVSAVSIAARKRFRVNVARYEALGICLAAGALAIGFHYLTLNGFAENAATVSEIQIENAAHYLPSVSLNEAMRLKETREVVVIDARSKTDFTTGHLEGAVNLPAGSDLSKRAVVLNGYSKEEAFAVYCSSSGCPANKVVAKAMIRDGFRNIVLVNDGWQESDLSKIRSPRVQIVSSQSTNGPSPTNTD